MSEDVVIWAGTMALLSLVIFGVVAVMYMNSQTAAAAPAMPVGPELPPPNPCGFMPEGAY